MAGDVGRRLLQAQHPACNRGVYTFSWQLLTCVRALASLGDSVSSQHSKGDRGGKNNFENNTYTDNVSETIWVNWKKASEGLNL